MKYHFLYLVKSNENALTYVDLRKKWMTNLMRNEIIYSCEI
jgi:hypothetical protein